MMVSEMLDMKSWAKEKIKLWELDNSQYLCYLEKWSLRDCHRMWQAFLLQIISSNTGGSSEASLQLLASRGLAKQSVHGLSAVNADGEDLLVQAGADGWTAADIAAAVCAGADVSTTNAEGCNGAWNAARYGHTQSLNSLVALKVNPHVCNSNNASPLFIAALNGHTDCIALLISFNCDANLCHKNGSSPLYVAAQNGHSDVIPLLVSAKANVDLCNDEGASATFVAASKGHSNCLKLLLDSGGDHNTCTNDGISPIYVAAMNGYDNCLKLLLSAGADPRSSFKGTSALDIARQKNHAECVRMLEAALA
jgi:ankyrin repeat protein